MTKRGDHRWAQDVGLDTSKKKRWAVTVTLETSGELPTAFQSGRRPYFWLKIVPNGWCVELLVPVRSNVVMKTTYISWYPTAQRFHQFIEGGKGTIKASQKLDPPKSLATLRRWLTRAEEKLGLKFRRDRPFVESTIKGGAKAMQIWIAHAR